MSTETMLEIEQEVLPEEIIEGYEKIAGLTWNSISAMEYSETGLPADRLHYVVIDGIPTGVIERIDKTSPTNIGFYLASIGAAHSMGFITYEEAQKRLNRTIITITELMNDEEVFIPTSEGKGLFVNWIQPSTGNVLKEWPESQKEVKQQLSSVDMAWLIAFSKLTAVQFPEFAERIQNYIDRMDLPFMFNKDTGIFHGCYDLKLNKFEDWNYDKISEARIAYWLCGEEVLQDMGKLINNKCERSIFVDSMKRMGRASWDGESFAHFWPLLLVMEHKLNPQWLDTFKAVIQVQKDFGNEYCNGHYGFTAGYTPDNRYIELRVPQAGESDAEYIPQGIINMSGILNMGIIEPLASYYEIKGIIEDYSGILHAQYGLGDTVDIKNNQIQRDQLLPNQATSLLSIWAILKNHYPQTLFMQAVPSSISDIYSNNSLF